MRIIESINGEIPPVEPMSMTIDKNDLYADSSGRSTETGVMLLYPIRKNVYTLSLEYILDEHQCRELETIISPTTLSVRFHDGDMVKVCDMYVSATRNKTLLGTKDSRKYRLTFSLIEL